MGLVGEGVWAVQGIDMDIGLGSGSAVVLVALTAIYQGSGVRAAFKGISRQWLWWCVAGCDDIRQLVGR